MVKPVRKLIKVTIGRAEAPQDLQTPNKSLRRMLDLPPSADTIPETHSPKKAATPLARSLKRTISVSK